MTVNSAAIDAVRQVFARTVKLRETPGMTWGIVKNGEVIASDGHGCSHLVEGSPAADAFTPGADSISRICSMTKSVTAASILALRDEGRLQLDAPVADYVPEAAAIQPATPDSPVLTIRHLLTMSAGFVTDNPWGDRMESMTREQFAQLLRGGLGWVHAPGTGFEYSNTGYALLGRVIDEVSGRDYADYLTTRFLRPLGMHDTIWSVTEANGDQRARLLQGHRRNDQRGGACFERIEFDQPGVYGAMAGLFSTVTDLARWTHFLASANLAVLPGGSPAPHGELLSAASRREMQQIHRIQDLPPVNGAFTRVRGYGYGLFPERLPDLGHLVSHSGGYPGFGSFMIWHRDSGLGVVALANAKYGPAMRASMQALREILAHDPSALASPPAELSEPAKDGVRQSLRWLALEDPTSAEGDAIADQLFAENMDPDVPREERSRRVDAALWLAGLDKQVLRDVTDEQVTVVSRANGQVKLDGPAGTLTVDVLMDPREHAKVQSITTMTVQRGPQPL